MNEINKEERLDRLLKKGNELLNSGYDQEAKLFFERAVEVDNTCAEAMNKLGVILADSGDKDGAVRWFNEAISYDSTYAPAFSNLGNIYFERGDYEKAEQLHRRAVNLSPGSPDFHQNLAASLKKLKRIDEYVREYKEANRLRKEQVSGETREEFNEFKKTAQKRLGCGSAAVIVLAALLVITILIFLVG